MVSIEADLIELVCADTLCIATKTDPAGAIASLHPYAKVLNTPSQTGCGSIVGSSPSEFLEGSVSPTAHLFTTRLISRTIGSNNQIVDEIYLRFRHSQPVEWMLPGIPATGHEVEIVVVRIACIEAGQVMSERVYWDQASVLAQVGLLEAKATVSETIKKKGVERLPVVGADAARAVVDWDV